MKKLILIAIFFFFFTSQAKAKSLQKELPAMTYFVCDSLNKGYSSSSIKTVLINNVKRHINVRGGLGSNSYSSSLIRNIVIDIEDILAKAQVGETSDLIFNNAVDNYCPQHNQSFTENLPIQVKIHEKKENEHGQILKTAVGTFYLGKSGDAIYEAEGKRMYGYLNEDGYIDIFFSEEVHTFDLVD